MSYKMDVHTLRKHIQSRELSPVEIVDSYLQQIADYDADINAFVTMNEQARDIAKEKEDDVMAGKELGPLHGIPIAIKDLTLTKGIRTTFGSELFKDNIPGFDAPIVKQLKAAGAIVLGKTNTPEFGHIGTTNNIPFGPTSTPWETTKTSGGSSGGSAAAVAASMAPIAEGSDGGGSIRIPASCCGVFGFKPSFGRIPRSGGENVFRADNFAGNGPLSRTVRDAALFVDLTQGMAHTDPFSLPKMDKPLLQQMRGDVRGMRIAYTRDFGIYEVDHEVAGIIEDQLKGLEELGCIVEEVDIDLGMDLPTYISTFEDPRFAHTYKNMRGMLRKTPEKVSDSFRWMIERGSHMTIDEYFDYPKRRTKIWKAFQSVLKTFDFIISPTLAAQPFETGKLGPDTINGIKVRPISDWMMTNMYNMTGLPAASVPAGFTQAGLPVGMQIAANRFRDGDILRLSRAYEEMVGDFKMAR